ncbi:MAG: carbohydrate ABC transporter permease [Acidipropionibacterium jensenii]|nr:carbohydrate ABC transporter permease [Acidipropionibacterium jensenii]MDN5996383.1 carbohydrate ABC transporter permease [Acidipropionibacterium jensenii]MDN6021572.1 carbohydrate ABC transporter permease [Acidipropionibacterium jensenii]MDN6426642.1 carbohydrate ABC transporter permease [Acidipropionibacterium jensenii]MDN6441744.1 carbohydrate ABC transporter permease [Acidipropionibacterium jensenii]MDN6512292.1 carbohydrate ABC transporter permease [Acidipropionibacterium jensenii]
MSGETQDTSRAVADDQLEEVRRRRRRPSRVAGRVLTWMGIVMIVVYCLAPFYWMIVSALRLPSMGLDTSFIPDPVSLDNFTAVFQGRNHFGRALVNSLIVAGLTTALVLVVGTVAAYAMARLRFRGKPLVLFAIISTSMFPVVTLIVPLLRLFTGGYAFFPVNWINTYQAMILPSISFALPLAVWTLNAYFRQLPHELEESAMVDGATRSQAFRRVILPLAAPGVFTTAIITFIAAWNEFLIALTMVNDNVHMTANVAISKFTGVSGYDTPYGTIMAAGVIVTVPLLIVVLIFQRRIVGGLAAGSLK